MTVDRRAVAPRPVPRRLETIARADGHSQCDAEFVLRRRTPFRDRAPPSRARKAMIAEGAAIVDVGGESTRPGHAPGLGRRGASAGGSGPRGAGRAASTRRLHRHRQGGGGARGGAARRLRHQRRLGSCSAIPAWRMRSPTPARPSSSCTTASRRTGRSTFSTMSSASSNARSTSRRAPACRSAAFCSIPASASARRRSRTIPASGTSTASAASARRSSSGSRASRSSAGSSAPRSTSVSPARSPPTRLRSCAALRCCGCMTSPKTAPRSTSSRR